MGLGRWGAMARMRVRSIARRSRVEDELERELRFHLDAETSAGLARGLSAEDARAAALRRLGGVAQVEEECRDMRRTQYLEQTAQDVRYALRGLAKSPGVTTVMVVTLALAIGANSAIFSVIEGVLLKPLPYAAPDRLVRLFYHNAQYAKFPANPWDLRDLRATTRTLSGLAGYTHWDVQLSGSGDPVKLSTFRVTAGWFGLLGLHPAMGRDFETADELPDSNRVILSDRVWRTQFGGARDVVGRRIVLDSRPFTIVGVMPPGTNHPGNVHNPVAYGETVDLWMPFTFDGGAGSRGSHFLEAIGRLEPGVSATEAETEMTSLLANLGKKYEGSRGWTILAVPLQEEIVGGERGLLLVLLGAVGLVLLIACVNAANLLLARATARQREIAVRTAFGATRARLVRQMLAESVVIALAGGVSAAVLAIFGVRGLVAMLPADFPRAASIGLNGTVFVFTFAIAVGAGLVFGLVPAWQAARFDIQHGLREGGRGATSGARHTGLRGALVTGEIALACVLLIGAGLLLRSFVNLLGADPGFRPQRVLTATISLPNEHYRGADDVMRFYSRLLLDLRGAPGVRLAGAGTDLPWTGYDDNMDFRIQGRAPNPSDDPHGRYHVASADYFRTIGMPLLLGRYFTDGDIDSAPRVVIINHAMAQRYWPGEDAIGKRVGFRQGEWTTVVGVVGDVKDRPNSAAAEPAFWWPSTQMPYGFTKLSIVLRAAGEPAPLATQLRSLVRGLDPSIAVSEVRLLDDVAGNAFSTPRFALFLVGLFAALALALAATGVYGVVAYTVSQRMREFGMRIALGAGRGDVLRLVLGNGLRLAVIGTAAGLLGAAALSQLLGSLLYGVKGIDPLTFGAVAVVALAVAALACYVPARRATLADPMESLRAE